MFKARKKIKLKKYIKRALSKGKKKEEIMDLLIKLEWDKETLEKIFDEIESKKRKSIEITIPIKRKEQEEELEEEKKPIGIRQELDELKETLDFITQKGKAERKLKKKKFKVPFKVKSKLKKLAVKNKVQVMLLQRTRNIKPTIGEIRDGMLLVGDQVYNGSADSTWLWNGKFPTHIVPEWDLQPVTPEGINQIRGTTSPLSPSELYSDCIKNQRSAEPQKIMIRAIEAKENLMLKKPMNVKAIVITIILTLIIAAILFGGKIV